MLAAVAAAALVVVASLVLGQALLALGGRRGWDPLAAPVGLAGLLVVCALAAKLPGRGGAAVIVAGVVVLAAAGWLVAAGLVGRETEGRAISRRESGAFGAYIALKAPAAAISGVAAALAAAAAAAIPFLVNDRVGVLGVALVNDDMANHLLIADWVQHGTEPIPSIVDDGYPLGPHSVAATLAELLGTGLVEAFAGLTLAIAAIGALTAFAALANLPVGRRTLAAPLAALPYLGAAYLVQGAFKEPLQAIFLIAFALLLARGRTGALTGASTLGRLGAAVPVAVLGAAAVYNYSFPGLFWFLGTAAIWWLAAAGPPSLHALARSARRAVPGIAAAAGIAALLTLPDWGRVLDFTGFGAFAPSGEQTGLGNLRQAISPLEALGIWPSGEFRLAPADAAIPAAAFHLGGLLAASALAVGVALAVRRRRQEADGVALLAALGAAAAVYAGAELGGTPYTTAKALAIAAPVAMLVALHGLLARRPASAMAILLATAFVAAAALSSFLVLRQAPVSPPDHADDLARIRPLVQGDPVLFLGRDDFIAWHLRGAPVSTHIQNFFSTDRVAARIDPGAGEKFDFDAVSPETLDRFDWVVTTSSSYASEPPANFEPVPGPLHYALWKRQGTTAERQVLNEDTAPGAVLDCDRLRPDERRGVASSWPRPPVEGREDDWRPSATITPEGPATHAFRLGRGLWHLSLAYDSPRPLELRISGDELRYETTLHFPANLDFRGPTPPFSGIDPAETGVEAKAPGRVTVRVSLAEAPLAGRLLGAEGEAHLRGLYAVSGARADRVPIAEACGEYVDWYRSVP